MERFINTTPDSQKIRPSYLHLIVRSKRQSGTYVFEPEFKNELFKLGTLLERLDDEAGPNCTGGTVSYHGVRRDGSYWPHGHIVYWHSKDNAKWKAISQFLRRQRYQYQWSIVRSPEGLKKYLQEDGAKEIYWLDQGAWDVSRFERVSTTGHESEEVHGRGQRLQEHSICNRKPADDGEESDCWSGEHSGTDDNGSTPTYVRGKREAGIIGRLSEAIEKLQSSSLSQFKEQVYTNELYKHMENLLFEDKFNNYFARAHDKVCFKHRLMKWEQIMGTINMDSLEMMNGKYLHENESVGWIKEWLVFNSIDIKRFVTNVKAVIDREQIKKNSIQLHGPPNSFKTVIATSIVDSCVYKFINNQLNGRTSQFGLQECVNKRVAFLDEVSVDQQWQEKFLLLLGGFPCETDKKFESLQTIPRTPVILCFNKGSRNAG